MSSVFKLGVLAQANSYFISGEYEKAVAAYELILQNHPHLSNIVNFNLNMAIRKLNVFNNSIAKKSVSNNEKIIIYTCNFGNYETIKEPLEVDPTVDYIIFTDNPGLTSKFWNVVLIEQSLSDPRRASRLAKILPHRYLPDHDISIYLDSSLELKTPDIKGMINECMQGGDIALYRHYIRNCVYDEIDFVMNSKDRIVLDKQLCLDAKQKYIDINYPRDNGLYENAFIFRRNTKKIQQLCELWWDEYVAGTERDQFTFMYALYVSGVIPVAINVGNQFRDNPYTNFYKHSYIASRPESATLFSDNLILKVEDGNTVTLCSVNWIVGGEDNAGWAYENNAKRFISKQVNFNHNIQSDTETDVAVYFDILLFDRNPVTSKSNIVRIGGPRPIDRLCGHDTEKLKRVLQNFHSVICLNKELTNKISLVHPNVHMIPNGIDLITFAPDKLIKKKSKEFTVGFAGSVKSSAERKVKGLDLVIEACQLAKVKILNVGRGKDQVQIPHDRMIQDFYSNIDVLVHPVDAGREGSSNVVMEALALGIPVVTTEFAGYHAEHLEDRVNYLRCKRNSRHIAGKILDLVNDPALSDKLSKEGRRFAERHHDLNVISKKYEDLIIQADAYQKSLTKISLNPFWYPVNNFATGRIRSYYPAHLLNQLEGVAAKLGYDPKADIVFVSQLADDGLLNLLNSNAGQFVIYDVCDKYYEDDRVVGGVHAKSRFYEIVHRANLIITSTLELKKEIYALKLNKPIVHIQDGIDFREFGGTLSSNTDTSHINTVGWFGNPGRGNLDSVVWLLEASLTLSKEIKLITKTKSVQTYPHLHKYAVEWQYDTFIEELKTCDLILVTHARDEQNKSPNRMLTALANGVPVIVSSSFSCEQILKCAGLEWAIVNTIGEYENAVKLLENPEIRSMYFKLIMPYIENEFGDKSLLDKYKNVIHNFAYENTKKCKKILFVSHNLSIGEGAPTSLYQTIIGLKNYYSVDAHVFCPMTGDFKTKYEEHGIPIYNYTNIVSKDCLKPLNANFEKAKADFQAYLAKENFDLVVCNTAKMLPYASFAIDIGFSAISIIRESSDEHIELSFSKNALITKAAEDGLRKVKEVVFVSDVTRKVWQERQWLPRTKVIHNGIITEQWDYLKDMSKEELRRRLSLPLKKKILLSVGTINGRKAQIDIINAYQRLPAKAISESYLVLVGARESGYLTLFKQQIDKLPANVKHNILLVPETDMVGEWYKASDIFVFSSHNESYPRVIVEALYFGLKIISSRVFGVAEQLESNSNAHIYEIGNVSKLSVILNDVILSGSSNKDNQDGFFFLATYQEMIAKYYSLFPKYI